MCREQRERLLRDAKSVQALRVLSSADILHLQLSDTGAPQQGLNETVMRLKLRVKELQTRLGQAEALATCSTTPSTQAGSAASQRQQPELCSASAADRAVRVQLHVRETIGRPPYRDSVACQLLVLDRAAVADLPPNTAGHTVNASCQAGTSKRDSGMDMNSQAVHRLQVRFAALCLLTWALHHAH